MSATEGTGPVFASPSEYGPAPGRLLVALPELLDPVFVGTVIYLLEYDEEAGSAGVVINMATRTPVEHVLPAWGAQMSAPTVVFRGGPVQPDGALCLADVDRANVPDGVRPVRADRADRSGRSEAGNTVGLVDLDSPVTEISARARALRVFAGHAGWSPGQLEEEVAAGAWVVLPGRPADVFPREPGGLWRAVLGRQPNRLALLSTWSKDPTLN